MKECGNTWSKGKRGEDFVACLLTEKGFAILHQNWRTPHGEVDLVASKNSVIYFFEVKTRSQWGSGRYPLVGAKQILRLKNAALWIWQQERKNYSQMKCKVLLVTRGNIQVRNLPLLYDTT